MSVIWYSKRTTVSGSHAFISVHLAVVAFVIHFDVSNIQPGETRLAWHSRVTIKSVKELGLLETGLPAKIALAPSDCLPLVS